MEGNSGGHSVSPSHSASASVSSSAHKRKLNEELPSSSTLPPHHHPHHLYPSSNDGALTSNDDLDSISARADSDADDSDSGNGDEPDVEEEEEDDEDDEEEMDDDDEDSMQTFTTSRLENSAAWNVKPKMEAKPEAENAKEERTLPTAPAAQATAAAIVPAPAAGIVVKDDPGKGIFTDNIQTSGAYSAREESLKREVFLLIA